MHAFTQRFFDRDIWYPKIGFDNLLFAEQLMAHDPELTARLCGPVFRGICDKDVSKAVLRELLQEGSDKRFVYWLTLNTHAPFNPAEAKRRFGCDMEGGPFGEANVCGLAEMWADVLDSVVNIATHPDLPPTDILVVGDHNTPLFMRSSRRLFKSGEVAWFALHARERHER